MHSKYFLAHYLVLAWATLFVQARPSHAQLGSSVTSISETKSITVKTPILKAPQIISIATGVPGIVEKVLVREGMVVNSGDALVRIRDDEVRMSLQQAELSLELAELKANRDVEIRLAEKSSEVAEQELKRALLANSIAADTYPPNEIDRYRLVFERSKLEIERAKLDQVSAKLGLRLAVAEKEQAELQVAKHTIKSPIRATVVSIDRQVGEWADSVTKVLELIGVDQLRLEGFIDVSEVAQVTLAMPAKVRVMVGKEPTEAVGKVSFISPIANPVNGQVRIFLDVDNSTGQLRPGVNVTAELIHRSAQE
jgi:multidrug efflux pump subunit AcrA (membrane-fusion protein)